jgi:hypothetical protein
MNKGRYLGGAAADMFVRTPKPRGYARYRANREMVEPSGIAIGPHDPQKSAGCHARGDGDG